KRMAKSPTVSVVVASFSGESALEQCLGSLKSGAAHAEVIVATNLPSEAIARFQRQFPAAHFLPSAVQNTRFELRRLALAQARGQFIGLIEGHCTVTAEWLTARRAAHEAGRAVVGGPIEIGRGQTTYDWALYVCEYSAYMTPLPEGPTKALLAAN